MNTNNLITIDESNTTIGNIIYIIEKMYKNRVPLYKKYEGIIKGINLSEVLLKCFNNE